MRYKNYTEQDIAILRSGEHTVEELAVLLDRSKSSVKMKLSKLGVQAKRKRKYELNEDYFNQPSDAMYYIVGFTMADGYIEVTKDKKYRLRYSLSDKDRSILEFIRDQISPTSPVYTRDRGEKGIECDLRFCSKAIADSLEQYGVVPAKTGLETFKGIPDRYFYSYLRGVFDGDGTCGLYDKSNYKEYVWKIYCSNYDFLKTLRDKTGFGNVYQRDNICTWKVGKGNELVALFNNLYNNASFMLDRKYQTCQSIQEYVLRGKA